jgi:hypothetical protein
MPGESSPRTLHRRARLFGEFAAQVRAESLRVRRLRKAPARRVPTIGASDETANEFLDGDAS